MQRGRGREDARRGIGIKTLVPPAAILAAGGRGERAKAGSSGIPKQFQLLAGRPVFMWSLRPLLDAGCEPVVVVVPADWVEKACEMTRGVDKLTFTVGGDSRQGSVANGLEFVTSERVVVQDAARPFVTADLVTRVLAELPSAEAAIAAIPLSDTLKRAEAGRGDQVIVQQTLDRTSLWRSQTPGAFVTEVLRDAHKKADDEGFVGTDESELIERYGGRVALVEGSVQNIKLTYPDDFAFAEAVVRARS